MVELKHTEYPFVIDPVPSSVIVPLDKCHLVAGPVVPMPTLPVVELTNKDDPELVHDEMASPPF